MNSQPIQAANTPPHQAEPAHADYLVEWRIELSATSPADAARQARAIQYDPSSRASVFHITDADGHTHTVDPEEHADVDVLLVPLHALPQFLDSFKMLLRALVEQDYPHLLTEPWPSTEESMGDACTDLRNAMSIVLADMGVTEPDTAGDWSAPLYEAADALGMRFGFDGEGEPLPPPAPR